MAVGVWNDVKDLGSSVVHVAEDVLWAPTRITHWVLTKMFGDPDAELNKYAAELEQMSKEVEALGKEISTALSHLTWHGPSADAFTSHAQGRVKEMNSFSDEIGDLGKAIKALADSF
ncbi:WXG100 family type VII secretion target [Kitasatospora sp. NPDC056138]|uniref:WXG100 family type VII secretion target n=1 Tax=Kitasatospora sp. NPDC056138 TaxID=3345724 RepID=UPI0035DB02D8